MLTSSAKAREPGNPPTRRTSNRHRKQGKGRIMDQHQDAEKDDLSDDSTK